MYAYWTLLPKVFSTKDVISEFRIFSVLGTHKLKIQLQKSHCPKLQFFCLLRQWSICEQDAQNDRPIEVEAVSMSCLYLKNLLGQLQQMQWPNLETTALHKP